MLFLCPCLFSPSSPALPQSKDIELRKRWRGMSELPWVWMWVWVVVCPRLLPCRLHLTTYIQPSTETLITDSCFVLRLFSCLHLFTRADFGSSDLIYNFSSHSCPAALFVHGHVSPSSSLWIDVVKKKTLQVGIYCSLSRRTLSSLWFLSASSAVMGGTNMCFVVSIWFSSWWWKMMKKKKKIISLLGNLRLYIYLPFNAPTEIGLV